MVIDWSLLVTILINFNSSQMEVPQDNENGEKLSVVARLSRSVAEKPSQKFADSKHTKSWESGVSLLRQTKSWGICRLMFQDMAENFKKKYQNSLKIV